MKPEPLSRTPNGVQGVHALKTLPEFFIDLLAKRKTFEIRNNDRNYQIGDLLVLEEWSSQTGYTGRSENRFISYITEYSQKEGYCVLGFKPEEVRELGQQSASADECVDPTCELVAIKHSHPTSADAERLADDAAYYKWRLSEILPLFQEARDALPAISQTSARLHNLSLTLGDRMDVAGTRTRKEFDALRAAGGRKG